MALTRSLPLTGPHRDSDLEVCTHRGFLGCLVMTRASCRAKASRFGADGAAARGCLYPLKDVVVVHQFVPRFRG